MKKLSAEVMAFLKEHVYPKMGISELTEENWDNVYGCVVLYFAGPLSHKQENGEPYDEKLLALSEQAIDEMDACEKN